MSDEEFEAAKRICERHGYVVARPGGVKHPVGNVWSAPSNIAWAGYQGNVVSVRYKSDDVYSDIELDSEEAAIAWVDEVRAICWGLR